MDNVTNIKACPDCDGRLAIRPAPGFFNKNKKIGYCSSCGKEICHANSDAAVVDKALELLEQHRRDRQLERALFNIAAAEVRSTVANAPAAPQEPAEKLVKAWEPFEERKASPRLRRIELKPRTPRSETSEEENDEFIRDRIKRDRQRRDAWDAKQHNSKRGALLEDYRTNTCPACDQSTLRLRKYEHGCTATCSNAGCVQYGKEFPGSGYGRARAAAATAAQELVTA